MKIDHFQIIKTNTGYRVHNYKLNKVIGAFTTYSQAYQAIMKILYTEGK